MSLRKTVSRSVLGVALCAGLTAIPASPAVALSTTADLTWMTRGKVLASARVGTTNVMFIGGEFDLLRELPPGQGGQKFPVQKLAALDLSTGAPIMTFALDVTSSTVTPAVVHSLAVSPDGSKLYVGGSFDAIGGQPVTNLGRIDLTAWLADPSVPPLVDPTFTPQVGNDGNAVYAILPSADKVYIGGAFANVNTLGRKKLAALNLDGTSDLTWRPKANKSVRTLTFSPDGLTIFVGGGFSTINAVPRQSVARVGTTDGALDPWTISPALTAPQTAWSLITSGNRLYGGFGRGPNFAAAFRIDTAATVWKKSTVGNVQDVALNTAGTRLFIGGHFGLGELQQDGCSTPIRGLIRLTLTNGAFDCGWVPQLGNVGMNFQGVWTLLLTDTYLWIGGGFQNIAAIEHQNLARFTL